MTVPVQPSFSSSTASGSTTVFPYGFKIANSADLSVTIDGVLQTSGYTVSGVGEVEGGDVTFSVAPAAGAKVVRFLNPVLNREIDYQQFGDWNAETVNLDMDRLWLAMQSLNQNTSRSLKLPVDTAANQEITESPAARANKGIKFDSDGNLTVSQYDPDEAQTASAANAAAAQLAAEAAEAAMSAFDGESILPVEFGGTGADTAAGARTALGLGSAATKDAGTGIGDLVEVDGDGGLPALDGSKLTGISTVPDRTGHAGKVLKPDGWGSALNSGTPITTTSGTAHDFTGIPGWVKRITINFDGVSTNGTSNLLVQIGDSGGIENSGYKSSGIYGSSVTGSTAGFAATAFHDSASETYSGSIVLSLIDSATFKWSESGILATEGTRTHMSAGSKSLSSALDRLRITTVNGSDVFDAGSINILYE